MKRRNLYTLILIITVAVIFAVGLSLLVFAQKDLSLHQNEKKTIFGGVYRWQIGHLWCIRLHLAAGCLRQQCIALSNRWQQSNSLF